MTSGDGRGNVVYVLYVVSHIKARGHVVSMRLFVQCSLRRSNPSAPKVASGHYVIVQCTQARIVQKNAVDVDVSHSMLLQMLPYANNWLDRDTRIQSRFTFPRQHRWLGAAVEVGLSRHLSCKGHGETTTPLEHEVSFD